MKVSLIHTHLVNEPDEYWETIAIVYERTHEKNSGDAVHRLGTIKAFSLKHFLCPIRSQHSVDHLEMVW